MSGLTPGAAVEAALGACATTPALLKASQVQLLEAVVQCLQLGIDLRSAAGHAHLLGMLGLQPDKRAVVS